MSAPGRPKGEYRRAEPGGTSSNPLDATREWLERALAYVRTLPPKKPKPRKKR